MRQLVIDYEVYATEKMSSHEQDFIIAYSNHMKAVYRDLASLRKKAHENNIILRRDQRV